MEYCSSYFKLKACMVWVKLNTISPKSHYEKQLYKHVSSCAKLFYLLIYLEETKISNSR